jgi:oxygen-independent coproporphyrinogen-3 oxidase
VQPLGIYIHVPFCVKKCLYCDFVSYVSTPQERQRYFQALAREIDWYEQHDRLEGYQPATLYVGGGTPSVAIPEIVRLRQRFPRLLTADALEEATIEVNPGTVRVDEGRQLRQAGFNRLSIGVQSFCDAELRRLGRIHTADDARRCVDAARRAGFENISLDLMSGIPGATPDTWLASVRTAIALGPEHVSTYTLTLEPDTPLWRQQAAGQIALPDEDAQIAMYEAGVAALTQAGYEHYEISNFARPGRRSRHNQIYWRNDEYLGLGAAAHSYLHGWRYWNETDLKAYRAQSRAASSAADRYPPTAAGAERLDASGTMGETIMLNLRLLQGIDTVAFRRRFGQALESVYAEPVARLQASGLLVWQQQYLRLTPRGIQLSNEVFQEFLATR